MAAFPRPDPNAWHDKCWRDAYLAAITGLSSATMHRGADFIADEAVVIANKAVVYLVKGPSK